MNSESEGEIPMTDYQFNYLMELKEKVAELTGELSASYSAEEGREKPGMSDYQFKQYESLRGKFESLSREVTLLRMENAVLKSENKQLKKNLK
ncbi:MAG: hypothetical protein FWG48_05665 [Oscillospiraceae bacterium]|nr:hypothetical protein [Oscillospiraceae bacterium]